MRANRQLLRGSPGDRAYPRLRLHLNADAVHSLARGVQYATCRLGSHVDNEAALTIPRLDRLHDVSIGRQHGAIGRDVVDRPLNLVEYKD